MSAQFLHKFSALALLVLLALLLSSRAASAADPEQFYKGNHVAVVIGYSVGGGFDSYARLLAKHIGKHIPGHPAVVPQNMPGAASLKAVDYLVNVAPKDGTVIGTFSHTISIAPLLGQANFDPMKLEWLGSVTDDTAMCVVWHNSKVKSWADLKSTPLTLGGTGKGSDPDQFALLFKNVLGQPIKLVTGYPGTAEMVLATERGEIDGFCGLNYSTIRSRYRSWIDEKKVTFLVQAAMKKNPDLPDVPLALDFAANEKQKQILTLFMAAQSMARPFAMPPGTIKERADFMRTAFMETLHDQDFLKDAKKAAMDVNPIPADEILALLKKVYATPPETVQEAIRALND
jgi:tripartite-type tricarboxylate transporter receptor subunit TctC